MDKKSLVIHVPVIHKGYLDFLNSVKDRTSAIYLIDNSLLEKLTEFKPDIASISVDMSGDLLKKMGFETVKVLNDGNVQSLRGQELILINDEASRNLYQKFFNGEKVEWQSVFLRWDKS